MTTDELAKMSCRQLCRQCSESTEYLTRLGENVTAEDIDVEKEVVEPAVAELERRLSRQVPPSGVHVYRDGVEVKVLTPSQGPLWHTTTDGAIVPNTSAFVYAFEMQPGMKFTGKIIAMKYQTWFDIRWDDFLPACWNRNAPDGKWGCYSTPEAATLAKQTAEQTKERS